MNDADRSSTAGVSIGRFVFDGTVTVGAGRGFRPAVTDDEVGRADATEPEVPFELGFVFVLDGSGGFMTDTVDRVGCCCCCCGVAAAAAVELRGADITKESRREEKEKDARGGAVER